VEIVTEQQRNVVVLPTAMIQWTDPNPFVWVLDGESRAEKQPISLGLEGLQQVQISSGLAAGDEIVQVPPGVTIEAGDLLAVEPSSQFPPEGVNTVSDGQGDTTVAEETEDK
jgi:HlyD family secretion protein